MEEKSKIKALLPFLFIIPISVFIFSLRSMVELNRYSYSLTLILPLTGLILCFIVFYQILITEKRRLKALGFKTDIIRGTTSIVFGIVAGIFFFFVYFGAHPGRMFPPLDTLIYFNIYNIFCIITNEIIYRAWTIFNFRKAFSIFQSIILSTLAYIFINLATVGQDMTSIVGGQIDATIIIEIILSSLMIGLFLNFLFMLTRCIYGNIIFMIISNIPIIYEKGNAAWQGNLISAIISGLCFIIMVVLIIRMQRPKTQKINLEKDIRFRPTI
jgi:hypothetical protein